MNLLLCFSFLCTSKTPLKNNILGIVLNLYHYDHHHYKAQADLEHAINPPLPLT